MNAMINETIIEHFSNIDEMAVFNRYLALYFIFQKEMILQEELATYLGCSFETLDAYEDCLLARQFVYYDEDIDDYYCKTAFDLYDIARFLEMK